MNKYIDQYEITIDGTQLQVTDSQGNYTTDLAERLLTFAVDTLQFLSKLPPKKEYEVIRYQLSKSTTSIGANYEESQDSTFPEFKQRIRICTREARESLYWYKIIHRLLSNNPTLQEANSALVKEASEIRKIFGAILKKVER